MISEEHLYWLAFSCLNGIGPKRFTLLKDYFGSAKLAWLANPIKLRATGLPENYCHLILKFRSHFDPGSYYLRLKKEGIKPLFIDDNNYPLLLKNIDNAPFIIYVKGDSKVLNYPGVAIVGSRRMTSYGFQVIARLVPDLCAAKLTIISGLARGVDSQAHKTTLLNQGQTVAVLGSGIDIIYPPENQYLAAKIAETGALVSEFPLGCQAAPGNFPQRNRIISGLSLGVVVIEGRLDSGSMNTAALAASQGREVFAVPGPITSTLSAGPSQLIKSGAKLVWEAKDILEELNL